MMAKVSPCSYPEGRELVVHPGIAQQILNEAVCVEINSINILVVFILFLSSKYYYYPGNILSWFMSQVAFIYRRTVSFSLVITGH